MVVVALVVAVAEQVIRALLAAIQLLFPLVLELCALMVVALALSILARHRAGMADLAEVTDMEAPLSRTEATRKTTLETLVTQTRKDRLVARHSLAGPSLDTLAVAAVALERLVDTQPATMPVVAATGCV